MASTPADLVSTVHQGTCSAYTPMEYSILHFRKLSDLVARMMRTVLIRRVYHIPLRELKYDKSTKVLPEQPLMNGFSRQPEIEGRPVTGK